MLDGSKQVNFSLFVIVFIGFSWQQWYCDGLKLPDYIKACSVSDPKIKECMKSHAQDAAPRISQGDPKYHVPPLTPMEIKEIILEGTNTIQLALQDVKIYGLEDAKFLAGNLLKNDTHYEVTYKIRLPMLVLLSHYNIKGRILVIPLTGDGPSNITLVGSTFEVACIFDLKDRKGREYLNLVQADLDFVSERLYFDLKNLLGDKNELGMEVNKALNDNWQVILSDLKPAIVDLVKEILQIIILGYTNHIPVNELLLP